MARKTDYRPEYDEQAYKLCLLGADDKRLADFFETSEQTINAWKKKQPSFLESLKKGKDKADAEIAKSLYHRAKGASHPEERIVVVDGAPEVHTVTKHHPPDTAACIIWLKNRQRDKWSDTKDHRHDLKGDLLAAITKSLEE